MMRFSLIKWLGAHLGAICLIASAQLQASLFRADDVNDHEPGLSRQVSLPQYIPGREGAPASSAVRAGNVLYLSGLLGSGPDGKIVGDVSAQTHTVMGRLKDALARNDSSMGQVLHCTMIVTDIQSLPLVSAVYTSYFPEGRLPARTAFEASGLAANALVEVGCTAVISQSAMRP
jgi:enamine deaminase RidA (YjgF/YER057c/UK114 family)